MRFAGSKSQRVVRWASAATCFIAYAPDFPFFQTRGGGLQPPVSPGLYAHQHNCRTVTLWMCHSTTVDTMRQLHWTDYNGCAITQYGFDNGIFLSLERMTRHTQLNVRDSAASGGFTRPRFVRRLFIWTSRITWKIHESKNHLATLPEARTVTLSIDRPRTVPSSQPRVELLRADWSPMHFERLRLPVSNKNSSDSSVREKKCWEIDEIDEGDDVQYTCKRS